MQDFDIYFSGQLLPNADPAAARAGVGKMFKLEGKALERLFSGNPVRIARSVDVEKANRYRAAFRTFGALIDIVPHHAEPPAPGTKPAPADPAPDEDSGLTLLPANSGTLEDCAPVIDAQHIPDVSGISLADPGTRLLASDDSPAIEYDTSAFSLGPANTGSLADCTPTVKPRKLPDISHLGFQKDND